MRNEFILAPCRHVLLKFTLLTVIMKNVYLKNKDDRFYFEVCTERLCLIPSFISYFSTVEARGWIVLSKKAIQNIMLSQVWCYEIPLFIVLFVQWRTSTI